MPKYSWHCIDCGNNTDVIRPMSRSQDAPTCDYCEVGKMERLYGAALQFTYGRDTFHSGQEGTGETLRETEKRWVDAARKNGVEPERV